MQVKAAIQNIILGTMYIEHVGVFRVRNHSTGLLAVMELCKPRLMTMSAKARREGQHQVKGHLEQQGGQRLAAPTFHGRWSESLRMRAADGAEQELWRAAPVPADNRCAAAGCLPYADRFSSAVQHRGAGPDPSVASMVPGQQHAAT